VLVGVPAGPPVYGPDAFVVISSGFPLPSPWIPQDSTSKWIGPVASVPGFFLGGVYTYRLTFDLTGLDPSTAVLTGRWATDNTGQIFLNGKDTGLVNTLEFVAFTPFTLDKGFIPGINTLDFLVDNQSSFFTNPTGLRVEISGTASSTGPAVPEPAAVFLFSLGMPVLLGLCWRRHSKGPKDIWTRQEPHLRDGKGAGAK